MRIPLLAAAICLAPLAAHPQDRCVTWSCSPQNWQNSPRNWNNSPGNWSNSPRNWQNSPYNTFAPNALYDGAGNRMGYSVLRPDGGMNYFDNGGNRMGYAPSDNPDE